MRTLLALCLGGLWCHCAALAADVVPPKANLQPADRAAWQSLLGWPQACEDAHALTDPESAGLEFHRLSAGRYLVRVPCALGAYQGSQVYAYWNEAVQPPAGRLLSFPVYDPGAPGRRKQVVELWGQADLDAARSRLTVFNRFRGIGDCGWLATYRLREPEPVLERVRLKVECDGTRANDPGRWKAHRP